MSQDKLIQEYISRYDGEIKERLIDMRTVINEVAPDAEERMAYHIPTFFLRENLVHYSANKNHIGFYPGPTCIAAFQEELKGYKNTKGAVQFPYDEEFPCELIRRMVEYRVQEIKQKMTEG